MGSPQAPPAAETGAGPLRAGALLLLIVGAARGLGGVALLLHGRAADSAILAAPSTVIALGAALVAVGALGLLFGIGVWRRSRLAWAGGLAFGPLFVLDGLLNGSVLFGSPRPVGTISTTAVAIALLALLIAGRAALRAPRGGPDSPSGSGGAGPAGRDGAP